MNGTHSTYYDPYQPNCHSNVEYLFKLFYVASANPSAGGLSLQDPSKKVKGDVMDLRLDIERRKRFAGKESKRDGAKSSGGSRGPSRERSSEKAGKHHKKSK